MLMVRIGSRRVLVLCSITAVFVATAWTVAAAASYDATCNSSGDACIWENGPFITPLAATTGSDSTYADDKYPNTQDTLNNTASSLKNKFDVHDVIWFTLVNYGGLSICVDHNTGVSTLGPDFNDHLSSHAVVVGSSC
jgi:hypothetical protein